MMANGDTLTEQTDDRLLAALGGDQEQFSQLTEPHRRELQVHCYRILGSLQEAEDLVQETFVRAWRRLDSYRARASFRAWLYKIATNACLDALDQRRSRRLLPMQTHRAADPAAAIEPPLTEIPWLEPFPNEWLADQAASNPEARYSLQESVSLAFLTALQALPPRQRAALILRDVLDWSAREVAELLETTTGAANSALHRARTTLAKHYHAQEAKRPSILDPDEETLQLLDQYVEAWESADIAGLVALLRKDAILAMPPSPSWYRGRDVIRSFAGATLFADEGMFSGPAEGRWKLVRIGANAQPAFALYQRAGAGKYEFAGIHVLRIEGVQLDEILSFLDPGLAPYFDLQAEIAG